MDSGDASTLTKIAIFCVTFSIITTMLCAVYAAGSSDYDYDTIKYYQSQLTEYTGGNLVNETPWVLTAAYTPFVPGDYGADIDNHIDPDGWLYGSKIDNYPDLNKAIVSLDKDQKSDQMLSIGTPYNYSYKTGEEVWRDPAKTVIENVFRGDFDSFLNGLSKVGDYFGFETSDGYTYNSGTANNWNYSGYRYVFDPTLPFSNGSSSKDGSLSIVWYDFEGQSGLSGGLVIYGSRDHSDVSKQTVVLASYSAADIIAGYQTSNGYATTFDFNFEGTHLHLSIKFSPTVYESYSSLREAWDEGAWTMSISSSSAGNYFDVENTNAFTDTAGSMMDTFIQIFTFDYPKFQDEGAWANIVLWLIVGLPMTLGLLFITLRTVGGVFKIF